MKNILIISLLITGLYSCKSNYECTVSRTTPDEDLNYTYIILYEDISSSDIKDIEAAGNYTISSSSFVTTCEKSN